MKHKNIAAAAISAVLGLMSLAISAKESYIGTDSTVVVRDYIANMEYVNGVLERVNFEGGYIDMTGESPRYMYYVTDHLGNVRTVVDEDGNVCQVNHYYPYGDRIDDARDISAEGSGNMRLFGGKEYSEDTGLHDFEARYDNTLFGRFTTIDPLAEKYYSVSPYAYCAGNPVNRVDPSGKDWWRFDENGNLVDDHPVYDNEYDGFVVLKTGEDGSLQEIEESRVSFPKGSVHQENNGDPLFSISRLNDAIEAFESLASYTDVEWSFVSYKDNAKATQVGNSHGANSNRTIIKSLSGNEKILSRVIHSHPSEPYPSGADKTLYTQVQHVIPARQEIPLFQIYHVSSGKYIKYTQKGPEYDPDLFLF